MIVYQCHHSNLLITNARARGLSSKIACSSMAWFEHTESWSNLRAHVGACTNPTCRCKDFQKKFGKWAKELVADDDSVNDNSWLWFTFNDCKQLRWVCLFCNADLVNVDQSDATQDIQISNMKKHHISTKHQTTVARKLGLPETQITHTAPSKQLFSELLKAFRSGDAPTMGYTLASGTVAADKALVMIWVISEAENDVKREQLAASDVINIMRDERHARMHVRFRCASASALETHSAYLGQARGHTPDSIGISEATVRVFKDIATSRSNCPARDCAVEPHYNEDFFQESCDKVEATSIDSAENEVVAVTDMCSTGAFKNNTWTLRDSAHSARRILSRLWKADDVLKQCWQFFMLLATIIQWSPDMRQLFETCCEESNDAAISTTFSHMRAAKHRIETWLTPLSRSLTNPSGLLGFAQKLHFKRSDNVGAIAITFLTGLSLECFVLAGMMADAATETLNLIRELDKETVDIAEICDYLKAYLDHIVWMFHKHGVLDIKGHTAFIIYWLESRVHHFVVKGKGMSIGGSKIPATVIQKCFAHMHAWVCLAEKCLSAEFPSFEIINCFSCFKLPRSKADPRLLQSPALHEKLRRLEQAFKQSNVVARFPSCWHPAWWYYSQSNYTISYWDAWRWAISKQGAACNGLLHLIVRGQVFIPVTSKIEQSFALIDARLSSRKGATAAVENQYINLLMMTHTSGALDEILDRCQKIWQECFCHHARTHVRPRSDKGIANPSKSHRRSDLGGITESEFIRNITSNVRERCPEGSSSALDGLGVPSTWTAKHQAELDFQVEKRRKKQVDYAIHDKLLPDENTRFSEDAKKEVERRQKSYADRCKARAKFANQTTAIPPTMAELRNSKVFLDAVAPESCRHALATFDGVITKDVLEATLIVSDNIRSCGLMSLVAILRGLWVVNPAIFTGPSVKYDAALSTPRIIWASPNFRSSHPSEWLKILEVVQAGGAAYKWKVLYTAAEWAKEKANAEKKKTPSMVVALVIAEEQCDSVKHAFTLQQFLEFICKVNPNKGSIGLLNM
jgi:hypothetical protein